MSINVIGAVIPGPDMTNNEKEWGISYKEMAWVINALKHNERKIKSSIKNGETMLHICARNHDGEEACETLVKSGYNVNAIDMFGHTPLFCAIGAGNYEVCETLLNLKADVNHQDFNLNTPLHKAIAENNLDIIKLLLKYDANINTHNIYGESPLKLAAQEERLELCKFIIDNGGEY